MALSSTQYTDTIVTLFKDVDFSVENGEIVLRDPVKLAVGSQLWVALQEGMRIRSQFDAAGHRKLILNVTTFNPLFNMRIVVGCVFNGTTVFPGVVVQSYFDWTTAVAENRDVEDGFNALADPAAFAQVILFTARSVRLFA